MRRLAIGLFLWNMAAFSALAQSEVERAVLQRVRQMMEESGGRVSFSELHNDPRFDPAQRAFLSRLYEVFFQIPSHLEAEFESQGRVPSRAEIGAAFGISPASVELLLKVMESDQRVPSLFERDPSSREIVRLNLENIDGFIRSRGDQVRMTHWEDQQIPEFQLETFSGERYGSADLQGHSSLLYFWFTGCPPCVRIAPILAELDKEYRDRGFLTVGLNADQILEIETSPAQTLAYLEKNGTEYPNLRLDEATRKAFGSINVYPTLFFVRPDGSVARHLLNFQDRETLETIIQEMLN